MDIVVRGKRRSRFPAETINAPTTMNVQYPVSQQTSIWTVAIIKNFGEINSMEVDDSSKQWHSNCQGKMTRYSDLDSISAISNR